MTRTKERKRQLKTLRNKRRKKREGISGDANAAGGETQGAPDGRRRTTKAPKEEGTTDGGDVGGDRARR